MKKIFNKFGMAMIVLLVGAMILSACGDDSDAEGGSTDGGDDEGLHIEVVAKGFQHDFWRAVNQGAEEAAEEYGATINFVGPQDELAIAEQVEMINNAVNKQPAAIALAALDTDASLDALSRAMDNEIPIIGFDSGVPDAPEGSIVANASTDNYAAGESAAENMLPAIEDQLSDGGVRIGVVAQELNSLSITERTAGFVDKMTELVEGVVGEGNVAVVGHQKLENDVSEDDADVVIETRVPAELTDAAGQTEAQTLLNKDDLIGIYGSNEFSGKAIINAANALSEKKLETGEVIAVGFDSGALQLDAIRNEVFYGAITQDPVAIGYNAVEMAIQAANGEDVSDVDTGSQWYNADNVDSDEISPLVYE